MPDGGLRVEHAPFEGPQRITGGLVGVNPARLGTLDELEDLRTHRVGGDGLAGEVDGDTVVACPRDDLGRPASDERFCAIPSRLELRPFSARLRASHEPIRSSGTAASVKT